jgi:hypothetical protein
VILIPPALFRLALGVLLLTIVLPALSGIGAKVWEELFFGNRLLGCSRTINSLDRVLSLLAYKRRAKLNVN